MCLVKKGSQPCTGSATRTTPCPSPPEEGVINGVFCGTPDQLMEQRKALCSNRWLRDQDQQEKLDDASTLLGKAFYEADPLPQLQPSDVDGGIELLKGDAGLSMDVWSAPAFHHAPPEAKADLTDNDREVEKRGGWLAPLLHICMALLAKAAGGERATGLIPMPVRVWDKSRRGRLQAWCSKNAGHWDIAINGCSALRSALLANFLDESAAVLGLTATSINGDLEPFYDSLCPALLVKAAISLEFDPVVLKLALQLCLAPRHLRADRHYSKPISPCTSIVAGGGGADHLPRAFLHNILEQGSPFVVLLGSYRTLTGYRQPTKGK